MLNIAKLLKTPYISKKIINFAFLMKVNRIAGLLILGVVWLWLVQALLRQGGGFTFKNLFLIVASGIIVFVPLWKKYFSSEKK